jgi:hypothetical protein
MDRITDDLLSIVRTLNADYLLPHRADKEISALADEVLAKLGELNGFFEEHKQTISRNGLAENAAATGVKLLELAKELREQ